MNVFPVISSVILAKNTVTDQWFKLFSFDKHFQSAILLLIYMTFKIILRHTGQ